jgi:hypothetical protein
VSRRDGQTATIFRAEFLFFPGECRDDAATDLKIRLDLPATGRCLHASAVLEIHTVPRLVRVLFGQFGFYYDGEIFS